MKVERVSRSSVKHGSETPEATLPVGADKAARKKKSDWHAEARMLMQDGGVYGAKLLREMLGRQGFKISYGAVATWLGRGVKSGEFAHDGPRAGFSLKKRSP